jgi:hypothetical protein
VAERATFNPSHRFPCTGPQGGEEDDTPILAVWRRRKERKKVAWCVTHLRNGEIEEQHPG